MYFIWTWQKIIDAAHNFSFCTAPIAVSCIDIRGLPNLPARDPGVIKPTGTVPPVCYFPDRHSDRPEWPDPIVLVLNRVSNAYIFQKLPHNVEQSNAVHRDPSHSSWRGT